MVVVVVVVVVVAVVAAVPAVPADAATATALLRSSSALEARGAATMAGRPLRCGPPFHRRPALESSRARLIINQYCSSSFLYAL
jgi:hypothetical protein